MNVFDPATAHPIVQDDLVLARRHAPVIRFAENEPFLPSRAGISILHEPGPSPSAPHQIFFEEGVARVIEYAIWWDWDIQHLYELEHVWVKLDAAGNLAGVDASRHGKLHAMRRPDGSLPVEEGRVTLFCEPGKHAFHAAQAPLLELKQNLIRQNGPLAGAGTILVNHMFRDQFPDFTREDHRAVKRHLQDRAYLPSLRFTQLFDVAGIEFLSWPGQHAYISRRVPEVLASVRNQQPLIKAVLLDSGDTLVDEATEEYDGEGYVSKAALIPGAREMMEELAGEGYRLVLVADGRRKSFETVLGSHGIRRHFEAEIISEVMGCEKPDARMFDAALAALGLSQSDAVDVVMVGNNLERDIKGANRRGMISVWQSWSPRRSKIPADAEEKPAYSVRQPGEIPPLLKHIELGMTKRAGLPEVK